ncbi:AAA family ATPase [Microbacterium esteraromaticum]|nr:AAA family ATPase [Microbacterium esteraromaticum]
MLLRIKSLRVRNFRTITDEQTIEFPKSVTIVGPNNTGKTNLLGAIRMFYTGYENTFEYARRDDLSIGKSKQQTTFVATFEKTSAEDDALLDKYDQILALYQPPRVRERDEVVLQLIFSEKGNPTYRLSSESTSKVMREDQPMHSRLLRDMVADLVEGTSVHYVPSSNSSEDLFGDLVSPLIKQTVVGKLDAEIERIFAALQSVSSDLSKILESAGLVNYKVDFDLPNKKTGGFLSHFDFFLADPSRTSAFAKGRGIQALAMLSCFAWIAEQESRAGKNSLWLIEEPESYLHPELYPTALDLLAKIEASGQVVRTTHALTMVPRDAAAIFATSLSRSGGTLLQKYESSSEATVALRGSLGIKFADFFGLGVTNVFTEGESDVSMIEWAISRLGGRSKFPRLCDAHFRSFGGVRNLEGFLHANYLHIRPETPTVSLFDGDAAGVKAIRAVQGYLGNHGSGFEAGIDYVIARKGRAIEGVFPDVYLEEMHEAHPGWFSVWIPDPQEAVADFEIEDSSKRQAANWLQARAESAAQPDEWSIHWLPLLESLEKALSTWRPGRR